VLELRAFMATTPATPLSAIVACWMHNLSHYHCGGEGSLMIERVLWVSVYLSYEFVYIHGQYCAYQIGLTRPIFSVLSGVDGSIFCIRKGWTLIWDSIYCPFVMVIKYVLWVWFWWRRREVSGKRNGLLRRLRDWRAYSYILVKTHSLSY
jgi:hypothetical protein